MRFLIDDKAEFALGWSPKCGNTHLKKIWYYLHNDFNEQLHRYHDEYNKPRIIPKHYTILIVTRNPYERLVSGVLDRLRLGTLPRKQWPDNYGPLTFEKYVDEILKENWNVVHKLHFERQLSDQFPSNITDYTKLYIQDINSVDYSILEKKFGKKIPDNILAFRGEHQNTRKRCDYGIENPAYTIPIDTFTEMVPLYENFYNKSIYDKVTKYYKVDLDFFKKYNLNYDIKYS